MASPRSRYSGSSGESSGALKGGGRGTPRRRSNTGVSLDSSPTLRELELRGAVLGSGALRCSYQYESASAISRADWYRASGFFAMDFITMLASRGSSDALRCRIWIGALLRISLMRRL